VSEKKIFSYCLWKRVLIFTIPLAIVLLYRLDLLKLEVFQAKSGTYFLTHWYEVIFLALVLCLIPTYPVVFNEMSARFVIDSTGITKKTFSSKRSLRWKDIFEYRDLLYRLVLLPVKSGKSICVDYFMNLSKIDRFNSDVVLFCKKNEVNMLVKPLTRKLIWGVRKINIICGLIGFCGLAVIIFPVDFVFPGMLAGVCHIFLGLVITFFQRSLDSEYSSYWIFNHTSNIIFFFLPLVLLCWALNSGGFIYPVLGAITYICGFVSMSGVMETLLVERNNPDEGRKLVAGIS
jgi:hypothetical protein